MALDNLNNDNLMKRAPEAMQSNGLLSSVLATTSDIAATLKAQLLAAGAKKGIDVNAPVGIPLARQFNTGVAAKKLEAQMSVQLAATKDIPVQADQQVFKKEEQNIVQGLEKRAEKKPTHTPDGPALQTLPKHTPGGH